MAGSRERFDDFLDFGNALGGFVRLQIQRRQQPDDMRAGGNGQHARRVQPVDKLNRRRFVAAGEGGKVFRQFQAEHETEAARVFDDARIGFHQPFQFSFYPVAEAARVFIKFFLLDD